MSESNPASRIIAPALMACAAAAPGAAAAAPQTVPLTIDRLFDAPALAGPSVSGLTISPDGSRITYLKGGDRDKDRLDLWEYDPHDGQTRLLVDSRILAPAPVRLSDEELARRERQRTAAFSGILEYSFAPSGRALLIPLNGRLYYCDLAKPAHPALRPITPAGDAVTDATISPAGDRVAFIRGQNLNVHDLANDTESALTRQRLLQHPHGVNVQVVGRLVQQQQVAAAAEHLGQVDAVPLAAGALAHLLLLLRAAEIEAGHVDPGVHRHGAQLDRVLAVGDFLEDRLVVVQGVAVLVDVGEHHAGAELDRAGVGLLLADDHAEQRGLAGAVGADHAHDRRRGGR